MIYPKQAGVAPEFTENFIFIFNEVTAFTLGKSLDAGLGVIYTFF